MIKEPSGEWELPGGGIEHGESPQETIIREVKEECGFEVTKVADVPRFTWSSEKKSNNVWTMVLAYETTISSNDSFIPSDEAIEFAYVSIEKMHELWLHPTIQTIKTLLQRKAEI